MDLVDFLEHETAGQSAVDVVLLVFGEVEVAGVGTMLHQVLLLVHEDVGRVASHPQSIYTLH